VSQARDIGGPGASDKGASPLFLHNPADTTRLLVLVALSVALMATDHHYMVLQQIRRGGQWLLEPIRLAAYWPTQTARRLARALSDRAALEKENNELRQRLLLARTRVQRSDILVAENNRLRALLQSSRQVTRKTLIAEITRVDLDPFRHRILINKGQAQGVKAGTALIDAQGIMGQVIEVTPRSSYAMLISDPDHALPVRVNRNSQLAVAYGTGDTDQLRLPNLPASTDLRAGDLLVTSGLGGRFPANYPVGRVTVVSAQSGTGFVEAYVRPAAALDRSQYVLLVMQNVAAPAPGKP